MNIEWKVPITMRLALRPPTMREILSFISDAAFLVNVNAITLEGSTPFSRIQAILPVRTLVFPEPAPATMSTGPSVHSTAFLCSLFNPSETVLKLFSITNAKLQFFFNKK